MPAVLFFCKYDPHGVSNLLRRVFQSLSLVISILSFFLQLSNQLTGGSTLGNISQSHLSMKTADIGLAQLSMHSSYESAGAYDPAYMRKLSEMFFLDNQTTIVQHLKYSTSGINHENNNAKNDMDADYMVLDTGFLFRLFLSLSDPSNNHSLHFSHTLINLKNLTKRGGTIRTFSLCWLKEKSMLRITCCSGVLV